MLHHANRQRRIHVLSLDRVLVEDVVERLADAPRLRGVEVLAPASGERPLSVEAVEKMTRDTITSRVVILDVRSQTLPRLRHAYNLVVGLNRADLNETCFSMLIGDGPLRLFHPGTTVDLFAGLLAQLRVDYSPSAFFYDPFLHYSQDERRELALDVAHDLPNEVPRRLARAFTNGGEATVEDVRKYFRAAGLPLGRRERARDRRLGKLIQFFRRRMAEAFPDEGRLADSWLSKAGYVMPDETLRLHLYPLFFEDWAADLLARAP